MGMSAVTHMVSHSNKLCKSPAVFVINSADRRLKRGCSRGRNVTARPQQQNFNYNCSRIRLHAPSLRLGKNAVLTGQRDEYSLLLEK
ncbi:hypothetical protein EYF80_028735 [Liparis tanakae]|uniref:Uncharacterized protein n=1 Tax=Liparis tanakae TaxID=230148 RepID=A0A4Z2H8I5_9TELE|nr:hypothetical protein EYF80_028735 [Liparis tanakae]